MLSISLYSAPPLAIRGEAIVFLHLDTNHEFGNCLNIGPSNPNVSQDVPKTQTEFNDMYFPITLLGSRASALSFFVFRIKYVNYFSLQKIQYISC